MYVYRVVDEQGAGMYRAPNRTSLWDLAVGSDTQSPYNHPAPAEDALLVQNWPAFADLHGLKCKSQHCGDVSNPAVNYSAQWEMYDQLKSHAFGFESIQQLLRWLYGVGWLEAMHELGGYVRVYDVPDEHVLIGRCQVTFDTRFARRMPNLSLIGLEV